MSPSADRAAGQMVPKDNQEYLDLKKYIIWVLATLLLLTAITITVGIFSDSLTIFFFSLDCGTSLILHAFNMVSIVIILRQNRFNFPYGTGKLENFSGFLYGLLAIPLTLLIIHSAVNRYLHPPATINLGLAQVPVLLSMIRSGALLAWVSRLCTKHPNHSPMMQSYFVNLKLSLMRSLSILAGLLLGLWLLSSGNTEAAVVIDLVIAVSCALYMLYCAVRLLVRNFRSLIDLPLPEEDQYKILNALVLDFDEYEGVGDIYSQLSGSNRFVQIELHFSPSTNVEQIERLRSRVEQRLRNHFSKLVFQLIPLLEKSSK